ncbi:hypothetical protein A2477_04740 [Candidatus Falkowbacteria bacterium RIFOXYC2_FULL_47_12]|uniref:Uncharacterized protein n=2 Tax=Candidatus Falkowiibacteriota TaxID=1752728 RepID=A0A1F5TNP8_9BACT|nr:MAG: hypothetical protein A2242_02755 [Candidatus Falkowbacteria bacterium RIFOXYA2_FULL_47_9]OGF40516.1 MAG: hypothetical protein A2477_04740 [Candidatus Falkowbacteria bacterium RIFOXYC2_FULL_47_12]
MKVYQTKAKKLPGSNYHEVYAAARNYYNEIKKKTKRRPYIRSAYWKKEKVFFDYFWPHVAQKPPRERMRRLHYFLAAIELLQKSHCIPTTKPHASDHTAVVHRFEGKTRGGEVFYVQVKEDKKGTKYFMSCFP